MSLPKPVMRGLLGKRLRFHLPIAFALSLVAAVGFKVNTAPYRNLSVSVLSLMSTLKPESYFCLK